MSDYDPYPIGNFTQGLYTAREPWLTPSQAWRTCDNAMVFRGRVQRRPGYVEFARLWTTKVETETHTAGVFLFTLTKTPIQPDSFRLTDTIGEIAYDDGEGNIMEGAGVIGTIDYETGDCSFTVAGSITGAVEALYRYHRPLDDSGNDNPVMGIYRYQLNTSGLFLAMVFDKYRLFQYNSIRLGFEDVTHADTWTGGKDDFFWCDTVNGIMVITNGVDPLYKFDGNTVVKIPTDFLTPTVDAIVGCLMVFFHKGRLVVLRPTLDGTLEPHMAMWTVVNPTFATSADWDLGLGQAIASTASWIRSADLVRDDILVWFDEAVFRLEWSDDFRAPFRFVKVTEGAGASATFGTVVLHDAAYALGTTAIYESDGSQVEPIDGNIPNIQLTWDQEALKHSFGIRVEEFRQIMWSYTASGYESVTGTLVLGYEDSAFFTYTWPFRVYGYYKTDYVKLWDDETRTWDQNTDIWDSHEALAGFPLIMGGGPAATVYQMNTGITDDGEPYTTLLKTGLLNPMKTDRVRLGHIDLLMSRCDDEIATVRVYRNGETSPYITRTVDLTGIGGVTNVRRRVLVNNTADYHQIEIEYVGENQFALDAMVPWFKSEGMMRQLNVG